VSDLERALVALDRGQDRVRVGDRVAERLLAVDREAGVQRGDDVVFVQVDVCGWSAARARG
jgi:hypothetical protein